MTEELPRIINLPLNEREFRFVNLATALAMRQLAGDVVRSVKTIKLLLAYLEMEAIKREDLSTLEEKLCLLIENEIDVVNGM